ncbi:MAG: pitrilysin family protein [Candidatus Gastranaerophilales bacterium]|nr:pitrilysin family protein [Candidatus Gastranaerophilales bacterium]
MEIFNIEKLSNGIKVITKNNPNTPRTAVNICSPFGIKDEQKAGVASLSGRLLLQGTKTRTAEEIANLIDENALEIGVDFKQDFSKIRAVVLNEDFDTAIDLMSDIMLNSTFEKLEKEKIKLKGEIEADLDNPKTKVVDNYSKNLYPNHPYGNSHTRVLEALNSISQDDITNFYSPSLSPEGISIVVVGNLVQNNVISSLEKTFGQIKPLKIKKTKLKEVKIPENKIVTIAQNDTAQAQILQGWIAPEFGHKDYIPTMILNTILGASGLSSRLFIELRDKKGLAYTVRSSYDPLKYSGNFSVYIATAPQNIKVCLDGFKEEIQKLIDVEVSDNELENAKKNISGKRAFFHETNAQQAHYLGYYDVMGIGAEYDELIIEKIKAVSAKQIQEAAQKYLCGNSLTSILAAEEFLKF